MSGNAEFDALVSYAVKQYAAQILAPCLNRPLWGGPVDTRPKYGPPVPQWWVTEQREREVALASVLLEIAKEWGVKDELWYRIEGDWS